MRGSSSAGPTRECTVDADPAAPHALNHPGTLWCWRWPLAADPLSEVEDMRSLGITGVMPQAHDQAVRYCRQHATALVRAGMDVACGLGYVTADAINRALDLPDVAGVHVDQEAWHKVADSETTTQAVLDQPPDAPQRVADAFYPILQGTGWAPVARAWS